MVYGDVDIAADIWDKIDHLVDVKTKQQLPLKAYLNGSASPPQQGDMLIYAKAFNNTGHVAIVTEVAADGSYVKVAEQNFDNKPWQGNFARKIDLIRKVDGYWLLDGYMLGWKRVAGESNKP